MNTHFVNTILFFEAVNDIFFFSSRRRHTSLVSDWSSDVCSTGGLALLLASKGIHTEHIENTVQHLSDGVVDLSTEPFGSEDYARKMRVLKMPGALGDMKVYAYRVGPAGIEMAALHRVR